MRVAIDARSVQPRMQGVGRHVLNLLMGLSARDSDLEFIVIFNDPVTRKVVDRFGGPMRARFQWVKALSLPGSLVEKVEIPWLLRLHKADLFHDIANTGVGSGGVATVVTVHELATLRFNPGQDNPRLRRGLRHARLIIAVSSSLADEIESLCNISRPKIRTVLNAVDPRYTERVSEAEVRAMRERFELKQGYFLCVTADRPNKNVGLVLELAGRWQGPEQWVFTTPGVSSGRLRHLDLVEDAWLRPLYSAASALIMPSSYEGFSLPPLEALSMRILPVVSDIPPHLEMLGKVLPRELFFDPGSITSLERSLGAVLTGGDPLRASVLENFRVVRDRYSFTETAEQVQAVYREALRG